MTLDVNDPKVQRAFNECERILSHAIGIPVCMTNVPEFKRVIGSSEAEGNLEWTDKFDRVRFSMEFTGFIDGRDEDDK